MIAHRVAYGVVSDLWMGDVAFITERHNCGNSAIFSAGHQEDLFQGLEKQKRKEEPTWAKLSLSRKIEIYFSLC